MHFSTSFIALFTLGGHASILGFNTFAATSCQQFQENIHITQQGHNRGNFPGGGRRSFEIIETDGDCSLILFEGSGNTGTKLNLGNQKNIHVCEGAADGRYFLSFDVYCA